MSDPKNHHYLPIFYLKQWTALDGRMIRYYRPHREVIARPIAPKYTGYEEGLYSLEGYPDEQRLGNEKKATPAVTIENIAIDKITFFIFRPPQLNLQTNEPRLVMELERDQLFSH